MLHLNKSKDKADNYVSFSYAQSGEDLIIKYIFRLRGIKNPSYLDLGANHPFAFNNTYLFYKEGAKGINVDANPLSISLFNKERSMDKNLNIGVAGISGKLKFYIFEYDALSTFSKTEAERIINEGGVLKRTLEVEVTTVSEIVNNYFSGIFPDLLNIDVEGMDDEIVDAIDFSKSKPKVICIESVEYTSNGTGKKRTDLIAKVAELGYTQYADTNINTIFVENNFWFSNSEVLTNSL